MLMAGMSRVAGFVWNLPWVRMFWLSGLLAFLPFWFAGLVVLVRHIVFSGLGWLAKMPVLAGLGLFAPAV